MGLLVGGTSVIRIFQNPDQAELGTGARVATVSWQPVAEDQIGAPQDDDGQQGQLHIEVDRQRNDGADAQRDVRHVPHLEGVGSHGFPEVAGEHHDGDEQETGGTRLVQLIARQVLDEVLVDLDGFVAAVDFERGRAGVERHVEMEGGRDHRHESRQAMEGHEPVNRQSQDDGKEGVGLVGREEGVHHPPHRPGARSPDALAAADGGVKRHEEGDDERDGEDEIAHRPVEELEDRPEHGVPLVDAQALRQQLDLERWRQDPTQAGHEGAEARQHSAQLGVVEDRAQQRRLQEERRGRLLLLGAALERRSIVGRRHDGVAWMIACCELC
mmetsp:Transcript_17545/g.49541  ORF Transcript_17545/g.49541 Transcript_17545/m.49541 type:complete len:328 (-) Transcript_17545:22-1005(-)